MALSQAAMEAAVTVVKVAAATAVVVEEVAAEGVMVVVVAQEEEEEVITEEAGLEVGAASEAVVAVAERVDTVSRHTDVYFISVCLML